MTGADLKAWRLKARISQAELAAELAVSAPTIIRLEAKPIVPRLYHLALVVVAQSLEQPLPSPSQ